MRQGLSTCWLPSLLVLAGLQACLFPQSGNPHKGIVVGPDMSWRYFIGNSKPTADWRKHSFDDSHWAEGTGGIGYGDSDDGTVIDHTISVYLRRTFSLPDPSQLTSMELYVDYDDAFVAYINNVEIARSAGLRGAHPAHNQPSSVSHEALLYEGGIPESSDVPLNVLQPDDNVLALQVHNVSESSTDLSSNAYLIAERMDDGQDFLPLPEWLASTIEVAGSNLPIVVITTENSADIPDEPKVSAHMGIVNNQNGRRNYLTNSYNGYDGFIGIETRGYSSQMYFPKKSYAVETTDQDGNNLSISVLGLPKDNDWILNASYYDRTFLRNSLAHQMSRMMGHYSSRTVHCELIVNGRYQGLYVFMEKIKRDQNRVNVSPLSSADVSGEAVTGGYIYEYSKRGGVSGQNALNLIYPRPDRARNEQVEYIKTYDGRFREFMRQSNSGAPIMQYSGWIDIDSFVDEMLIQEVTKNVDAYVYSSFFHKDRSAKLKAGPAWDFDQSFGNSTKWRGDLAGGWFVKKHDLFWRVLFEDADFQRILNKRWFDLRKSHFRTRTLLQSVDEMAQDLQEAQKRNFGYWPTIGDKIWREPPGLVGLVSYQQEVDYLKQWIVERMSWLDEDLARRR